MSKHKKGDGMNTDTELLHLAAKAAEIEPGRVGTGADTDGVQGKWNPLTDDGDALRLAVKLGFIVDIFDPIDSDVHVWRRKDDVKSIEPIGLDPYSATRRAIVRAAAEIGRNMK